MEKEDEMPALVRSMSADFHDYRERRSRKRPIIILLLVIFIFVVSTVSILGFFGPPPPSPPSNSELDSTHAKPPPAAPAMGMKETEEEDGNDDDGVASPGLCGNSSAEARALGCTFDQLTWSWYPPSCPHYANDEFIAAEDWKFYLDMYGQQEASPKEWEKAMNNELHLYGERREHITHCVYLMLSVAQVVRDGTPYAKKLVEYEHLAHCAKLMLKSLRKDRHWNSMDTLVPFVDYTVTC